MSEAPRRSRRAKAAIVNRRRRRVKMVWSLVEKEEGRANIMMAVARPAAGGLAMSARWTEGGEGNVLQEEDPSPSRMLVDCTSKKWTENARYGKD